MSFSIPGIASFVLETHPRQSAAVAAVSPLLQFSLAAIASGAATPASNAIGARITG
jgi:hypothetical protein